MGDFSNRVFAVVRRIPRGSVATYGQIARIIGAPRSARYVGYALRHNPSPGTEPGVDSLSSRRVQGWLAGEELCVWWTRGATGDA